MNYQQQAMVGATGVELVVALYDAALRSLYRAKQAVEEDDVHGRRLAVNKVTDIIMHLQAHLRPDVGGAPAMALSDFYAAMFALTLEASHAASVESFDEVIWSVRNVRDAWVIAAKDPAAGRVLSRDLMTHEESFMPAGVMQQMPEQEVSGSRWSA